MLLMVLPDISTDEDLLARLRRKDADAVMTIYEHYFPPLYQYVRLRVGDRALAQDIVSDVFVILIESLNGKSAPRENLRGWLFRVARHQVYQTYGKVRTLSLTEVEEWMPAPTEHEPEMQLGEMIDLDLVRHALQMLAADHQEVLILRFGQRLSLKETADIMGKSIPAIKSLQFRAIDTLRWILVKKHTEAANG